MSFDTEEFIMEIQNRPCIWDSSSNEYSDRNLKMKAWDEIVNIFKEEDEMTNQDRKQLAVSLQRKWKGIRGCFTRELNRQKSLKSGSCGPRKSEYIYFKQLLFLQNVVTLRESATDNEATDLDLEDRPKRMKKEHKVTEDDEFFEEKSIECRYEVEDEDRLFMLSLVSTLKKVPCQKKMATKIKIMTILDEATRVPNIDDSEILSNKRLA